MDGRALSSPATLKPRLNKPCWTLTPDLGCDVLKAGHHGAHNATGEAWLARLNPKMSVISCGRHNRFGHPAPATLARLAAHNVQTFRTDHQGAITFVSDGKTVTARPFLA